MFFTKVLYESIESNHFFPWNDKDQLSSCLNFLRFQPSSCLKVSFLFSGKKKVPLRLKSNICNSRWKEYYTFYDLLKLRLDLHRLSFVSISIVIWNGKIVLKHGSYCWYFRLNLKYLGWPYRVYIKTAKNGHFRQKLLIEKDFWAVLATFCCYDHGAKPF